MYVITNVDRPTDWVDNLVITEKEDGRMRTCLDPRPLNKATVTGHYRVLTPGDVQALWWGNIFTVVDMKDAFWHVKFSDEVSYLCTFHSPWKRKRFLQIPFGLASAIEVLQQRNDETSDIPNVYYLADELIIAGKDDHEHNEALTREMQKEPGEQHTIQP